MKFILWIMILILGIQWPLLGIADSDSKQLSLKEAIDLALKESEDISLADNNIKKAVYQYREALSSILPQVNGSVVYNYYPEVMTQDIALPGMAPTSVALQEDHNMAATVTVDQLLFSFGQVQSALKAAKYNKVLSRERKNWSVNQVMLQTTLSYLQVVLAQRNLAIIAQSYKNAQYNRHMLEVKYEMGRIPKADNIKAQADVAMRLPQLKKAQGDFEMAMNALKVFTGLSSEKK